MVGGLGLDLGLELAGIARLAGELGQVQRRAHAGDGSGLALVGRHQAQRLLGALDIAALEIAARQARERRHVLRVLLQQHRVDFGGALQIAGLQRLVGCRQRGGRVHGRLLAQQALDERLHRAFRLRALEAVERASVAERVDRRDGLDAQLIGERLVLVDVDLDEAHLAVVGADHLLQDRRELLAGAAPGRPEIDQHRRRARGLQHVAWRRSQPLRP